MDVNIGVRLSACVIGFSNPTHAQWSSLFRFEPSKPSHKRTFRARIVSLSIRTPQTFLTGRFGPISIDLSDTQRVVSVPTVVSAFSRRPFTRTHQTLLFRFFSQIIYTFFNLSSLHSFFLPTYIHPATHLLPSTHRPTSTHPYTHLLSTYLLTSTHTHTRQPTSTHLHPPNLPTYLHPNTHLPTYLHPPNFSHSSTYIPAYQQTQHAFLHPHIQLPAYIPPTYINTYLYQPIFISIYSPTYLDGIFPSVFRYTPHRRERLTLNS